jgi:hypothetical protein
MTEDRQLIHVLVALSPGAGDIRRPERRVRAEKRPADEKKSCGPTFFILASQKCQTRGDVLFFYSSYCFGSCQIIRFTK